jgi:hypothetical protein
VRKSCAQRLSHTLLKERKENKPDGLGQRVRPDDMLREANHLQLCQARAATNYRRNFVSGGGFFFTANLAECRLRFSSILSISSCPALCRASTSLAAREDVDGRDKPGHDDEVEAFHLIASPAAGRTR